MNLSWKVLNLIFLTIVLINFVKFYPSRLKLLSFFKSLGIDLPGRANSNGVCVFIRTFNLKTQKFIPGGSGIYLTNPGTALEL